MMPDTFESPGDVLEGQALLLKQGRRISEVHYYLSIPNQTHFMINPSGKVKTNYVDYASGFILIPVDVALDIEPAAYILEFSDKRKQAIQIERRYKKVMRQDKAFVSFGVKIAVSK